GHTVRFAADSVEELDARVPNQNVTFVVAGGAATTGNFQGTTISAPSLNTQTAGLSLQNGTLTNDGTTRAFTGALTLSDSNLTVAATRNTSFIVTSDITTTGNLQIGSLTPIDNRDKSNNSGALNSLGIPDPYNSGAQVVLLGTVAANNVTAHNSHLAFGNANTTITGDLTVNGGILYLDGGGPIAAGATAGQLTSKLAAGNLASRIILGQYTRSEMKLDLASDSNATVLEINQPFVIDGDINPLDNRRFWVSRNSGTNTRVNFNNITLKPGSVFGVQEDNTDVRASLKLAGNATVSTANSNTNIDYINISRDASLPAFDGTNPVVLTQGRLNVPNWQGSNNTVSNVFGTIGAGVQVDLVRGQLLFFPGSALDGVVRTQTAAANGGDSFVVSTSNGSTNDTTIGGTGRIELGRSGAANGPEDFEIRGTEIASGTAALHTHSGEIRVVNDGINNNIDAVVRSNRFNDNTVAARVQVNNVVLTPGSTVQLAASNGIPLTVSGVTLQGDATIDTASTGMTVTNVNAGANAVTFSGAQSLNLTNPVIAGTINVNNTTLTLPGAVNSTLNVNGGTVTAAGDVSGPVTVGAGTSLRGTANLTGNVAGLVTVTNGGTANLSGNVTGGLALTQGVASFNAGGATKTVTGPVSLDGSTIDVTNGTLDFGNTVLASTAASTVAGLREQRITGAAFDVTTPNTSNFVKLGPVMGQNTTATGWATNETYVYTGQFFVPDNNGNGTGSFAFAENFDDSVRLLIDGTQVINNSTFNDATGTGALTLPTGWHDVEVRFGQGTGGAGPVASDGWAATIGFGIDLDIANGIDSSTTSPVQSQYIAPLDNGSMNLFRTTIASNLTIGANSTLRAGGFTNIGKVSFTGVNSLLSLNPSSGPAVNSSASSVIVPTGVAGAIDVVRAGDKVTVNSLNLVGDLQLLGEGSVTVSSGSTGTGTLIMDGDGVLTVNGAVEGSVIVNSGTFSGNSTLGGSLAINDGILAPGLSPGLITASTLQALNGALFQLEIGSGSTGGTALPGVNFDQLVVTGDLLDLGGAGLSLTVSSALIKDDVFTIILNNGTDVDSGIFNGLANGSFINLSSGYQVQLSYFDNAATPGLEMSGGNDVSLIVTVPEPGSAMALIAGLATLAGMRRFRRRQN
ncbi:MAG TPA: hypothetical protein VFG14_13890, partial [Chthoniobacteraceae bacterium]|nr:hypothetical protein [Chthoniobacteraceae bacterium]